jgi:4-amino-4-deoxy-L-arabinose transferase-like glycosyltransferase
MKLPVILGIAFVLRLAVVLWLSDTVPHSDAGYYDFAARRIAADWGFLFDRAQVEAHGKLGWWPPLYPFFLGWLYDFLGPSHRVVVFAQVLIGTLVCWLVYAWARRAAGDRVARIAGHLIAVDPTYVFFTNILASENLYVPWMALGLWLFERSRNAAGWRPGLLAGIVFGLGALTRAIGLIVIAVAALAARRRPLGAWSRRAAPILAGAALIILPWTCRNAIVVGSPALICFGGGLNFYFGHNPEPQGYRDLSTTPMAALGTQAEIDRVGYQLGWEQIAREPWGFVSRGVRKVGSLFGSAAYAPHASSAIALPADWQTNPESRRRAEDLRARQRAKNRWLDGLFTVLANVHFAVLGLAAAFACARWKQLPAPLRFAAWIAIAWVAAHVVYWAQPRFRYPMDVPLALLAAWSCTRIAPRSSGRSN